MASNRAQLNALRRMVAEADHILETLPPLPENRTARCRELLGSALLLADNLLNVSKLPAAAVLGARGGSQTAKRAASISASWLRNVRPALAADRANSRNPRRIKPITKRKARRIGRGISMIRLAALHRMSIFAPKQGANGKRV